MAMFGEEFNMTDAQKREAFDAAKVAGHDYLVMFAKSVRGSGLPIAVGAKAYSVPQIDFVEMAHPARKETLKDDLMTMYGINNKRGLGVRGVYDLSKRFEDAAGDVSMLQPAQAYADIQAMLARELKIYDWKRQPILRMIRDLPEIFPMLIAR